MSGQGVPIQRDRPELFEHGVLATSVGFGHGMMVKTNGSLWASGDNYGGQLGNGTNEHSTSPIQVMNGVKLS